MRIPKTLQYRGGIYKRMQRNVASRSLYKSKVKAWSSVEDYKKSAEDLRKVGLDDSFMLGAAQAIEDFEKIHKRPNPDDTVRIINAMIAKIFRTKSKAFYDGYKEGMREVMFSRGLR